MGDRLQAAFFFPAPAQWHGATSAPALLRSDTRPVIISCLPRHPQPISGCHVTSTVGPPRQPLATCPLSFHTAKDTKPCINIYLYIYLSIYLYIYVCVCVCVCVFTSGDFVAYLLVSLPFYSKYRWPKSH